MSNYYCFVCDYDAKQKSNYDKHINTKKHKTRISESHQKSPKVNQKSTFSQLLVNQKSTFFSTPPTPITKFQCKYCDKCFKFKQSMYKHIKYVCKKNKDEDFQELARLLNEKDKQIVLKDKQIDKQLALRDKKMEIMQKQIDKLTNKLQIQNINQGIVQNFNNTINIQVLNHPDTDYSHLTPKDYITCIKDCNKCVKTLI